MDKPIFTVAQLTAKQGKLEDLKQVLSDLATETRQEKGALEYFFIEDQSHPNTILSIERWENTDAEAKHWETPHLKNALSKMGGILETKAIIHKGFQVI